MKQLFIFAFRLQIEWFKVHFLNIFRLIVQKISINDYFSFWERHAINNRLKLWKTIYLNLRTMPFSVAIKTPVWVYGDIKFYDLSGSILPLPNTDIVSGTFRLGYMDPARSYGEKTSVLLSGTIYYGNHTELRQGAKLRVSGELILERGVFVADNSNFSIAKRCILGQNTFVANNVFIMDNDVHYMMNIQTREVKSNTKTISIGEGNWIGSNTMIKKGTITGKYFTVVGPGACLCKNYSNLFEDYSVLAGNPLRVVKKGMRVISNFESEAYLNYYFQNAEDVYYFGGNIDGFCQQQ